MRISTNPAIQQALEQGSVGAATQSAGKAQGSDFAQMLMDVIGEVNEAQANAGAVRDDFVAGRRGVEIQDVMMASENASTALQLTMAVRNKVLEAYQELSRMQV
ncbi:MAG: flagellar hook-basal body complex protein FliE [Armatimonadetes bacterium Cent15-Ar3]|jgi:flagellar hook-basal body complex protein FliE|nr:MAG: flagellar hook-basal body complex protein FliE [Armatimonadetes bacterium Cent15-Ar3]